MDGQAENEIDADAVKWRERVEWLTVPVAASLRAAERPLRQRVFAASSPAARDSRSGGRYTLTGIPMLVWSALLQTALDHRRTRAAWCAAVRRFLLSVKALSSLSSSEMTRPCSVAPNLSQWPQPRLLDRMLLGRTLSEWSSTTRTTVSEVAPLRDNFLELLTPAPRVLSGQPDLHSRKPATPRTLSTGTVRSESDNSCVRDLLR